MNQKLTIEQSITTTAAIMMAAIGFLFLLPAETGLSFAATDSSADGSNYNGGDSGSGQSSDSGSNSGSGSSDQGQQQHQQQPPIVPLGGPNTPPGKCEAMQCDKDGKPLCPGHAFCDPIGIIVHTYTTTTTNSGLDNHHLRVTQQNCIAAALQPGFSSNAASRTGATYAVILGCFS